MGSPPRRALLDQADLRERREEILAAAASVQRVRFWSHWLCLLALGLATMVASGFSGPGGSPLVVWYLASFWLSFTLFLGSPIAVLYRARRVEQLARRLAAIPAPRQAALLHTLQGAPPGDVRKIAGRLRQSLGCTAELAPARGPGGQGTEISAEGP